MLNKIFVYGDELCTDVRDLLKLSVIDETIAEVTGKMYMVHRQPILLKLDDVTFVKGNRKAYGAIYEIHEKRMDKALYALDDYHGSSQFKIGVSHPYDLTYRTIIEVYPIYFDNIHEFTDLRYKFGEPVRCFTYLGNPKHEDIIYNVKTDRHHKMKYGFYKKGFVNLLERKGYDVKT